MEDYSFWGDIKGFLDIIKEEIFTNGSSFWLLIICIIALIVIIAWNISKLFSRKKEIKKFAKKYNLQLLEDEKKKFRKLDFSQKKNIIKGTYNGKQIEIYDFNSFVTDPFHYYRSLIFEKFDPLTKANVTFINGKPYYSSIFGYLPTNLIKKILDNKTTIKEWGTLEFNKKEILTWTLFGPLIIVIMFLVFAVLFKDFTAIIFMLIMIPILVFIMFFGRKNIQKQKTHNINGIITRVLLHDPRGYYDELDKRGVFNDLKVKK
ncbi:MAG TPA: hypothetical protein PKL13_00140 [bacterium]|nr:hypothetical protein [bacterium]